MLISIGYEIIFSVPAAVPMTLLLYTHPSCTSMLREPDRLRLEPDLPIEDFIDAFGNRCARIAAPSGRLRIWNENVADHTEEPDIVNLSARQHPVEELPTDVLQFLLPSRYCEADLLSDTAWNLFGSTPQGWARVQAVCDFVHNHVTFGYPHASPTKTANQVYEDGKGVCRDFQHLAITFCRCLNIPARYATGYLGDLRIPPQPPPMDFSAWFQVYLEGQWYDFDARFNTPRVGRILMATGRDAVDAALTTSYGPTTLEKFLVCTDEITGDETGPTPCH